MGETAPGTRGWRMTPAEWRAAGRLGGNTFTGLVGRIGQVHGVISNRAFGMAGPAGRVARLVHDAVAQGAYHVVGTAGTAVGEAAGIVASLGDDAGHPLDGQPGGAIILAGLNAVAGDRFSAELAPLAIRMAVRADSRDLAMTTAEIAAAFPDLTPSLAVFVHGFAETDESWWRRSDECEPYGSRLQAEFGYTPVYVRYNTGRHISDSGHDLDALLEDLAAAWPVRVREILLVGHSMGGLVIRSACHYGRQRSAGWVADVRHVFYLGSPHTGAPLARAAGFAGWALQQIPEVRPFAAIASGPSSARDLRHGYVLEEDWAGCGPGCCLRDHRTDAQLLAGASHYAISATVAADPDSPLGGLVGDLLVQPASAHGRQGGRQRIALPAELGRGLGRMHHFDLLNHPDVWNAIAGLLRGSRPMGAAG
jgi:pimeloyl-ACP methyl ester carboxylesterase